MTKRSRSELSARLLSPFQRFVRSESTGGLLLMAAALVAFAWANSAWGGAYEAMKAVPVHLTVAGAGIAKPLLLWVNDGLMALFFLLVGLEIKRELLAGELRDPKAAALPAAAAVGGMAAPAAIFVAIQYVYGGGENLGAWGVPVATDIAFALGVLSLLGSRVPLALKVFLTALAIVDDLGAILVIALFYTAELDVAALGGSLAALAAAAAYNRMGGRRLPVYGVLGAVTWYLMLKSGVHATVAGVLLAFCIPLGGRIAIDRVSSELRSLVAADSEGERRQVELHRIDDLVREAESPLHRLEHGLQPWCAYLVMPVFALFNAGFALSPEASLASPVSLGIFLGLLLGNPVGILTSSWLAVRTGLAALPSGVTWRQIYGVAQLAGIGFTMSLFIASLAFADPGLQDQAKLGILSGSLVAAVIGSAALVLGSGSAGARTGEDPAAQR
jgi:Na+:H+ antiporter, NhaA family